MHKQRDSLTREQVFELATLAIKNHHAANLDSLAAIFAETITAHWIIRL